MVWIWFWSHWWKLSELETVHTLSHQLPLIILSSQTKKKMKIVLCSVQEDTDVAFTTDGARVNFRDTLPTILLPIPHGNKESDSALCKYQCCMANWQWCSREGNQLPLSCNVVHCTYIPESWSPCSCTVGSVLPSVTCVYSPREVVHNCLMCTLLLYPCRWS